MTTKENMKKLIYAVPVLLAVVSSPLLAAGNPYYAGVQAGDGITILGGYQLDKTIALELDYTSYGGNAYVSNCGVNNCGRYYNYSSLGFYGVANIPVDRAISLFGKLGLVLTTVSSRTTGYNYYANDLGVGLGFGAQYDINKKVSARLGVDFNYYYSNNLYIGAIFKF